MTSDHDRPDAKLPEETVPYQADAVGRSLDSDRQHGRFVPGTRFGKRYRIVGLLGTGGMGEVYRADDLELGQAVALKFLPGARFVDDDALDRLRREVRAARQVSHPNVCRVYDIGEVDGQHFLSMEYVDGEDLASLLRRMGRPSQDKALQIARQLCAGLAHAHENGVLHRDLKPANIMIDGRGRVRVMDFGLAGFVQEPKGAGGRVGTPAYMAPEQLAGKPASVGSDVFALGLVLYEVFTGRRAFAADSVAELERLQVSSTPSQPSSLVSGLDPTVEAAILRCLEPDPAERPPSVAAVAAALPGGDPLAAALAAGETPSPEVVAASGGRGGLAPTVAIACLGFLIAGFLAVAFLNARSTLFRLAPIAKAPAVLVDTAREIVADLDAVAPPVDSAWGLVVNEEYIEHIEQTDRSLDRWHRFGGGNPSGYLFWYRQSPSPMLPEGITGDVSWVNPAPLVPGEAFVVLDGAGRLTWLEVVPAVKEEDRPQDVETDWSALFAAAGLVSATFQAAEPVWNSPVGCDELLAWEGVHPESPRRSLHVAAAAVRGRPVFFRVYDSFTQSGRVAGSSGIVLPGDVIQYIMLTLLLAGLVLAVVLARRNLRSGRGDRRGAFRLGFFALASMTVMWLCSAHAVIKQIIARGPFLDGLGIALMFCLWLGLGYLAIEPVARRRWPGALISWSRLLAGRFKDPRVGRDVLVGGVAGAAMAILMQLEFLLPLWLGMPTSAPRGIEIGALMGGGKAIESFLHTGYLGFGLFHPFVLLLFWAVLRKRWLAFGLYWLLHTFAFAAFGGAFGSGSVLWPVIVLAALEVVLFLMVMTRAGLLAFISMMFFYGQLASMPITLDTSAWYAGTSTLALIGLGAIAAFAAHVAMAGRPHVSPPGAISGR